MIRTQNFNTVEFQPLAVTGTTGYATFSTAEAIKAEDLMVANIGSAGAYVVSAQTTATAVANASALAAGTRTTYVPAGAIMTINKGVGAYIAAITDTGTTTLQFHAGYGS